MVMFHTGDLQSGIAIAVQQSKAVLCFVHDSSETSTDWESVLLEDNVSNLVSRHAVALKIAKDSQEAEFLRPICTITSTPAIIVIKDGQVAANLNAQNVEDAELRQNITAVFDKNEAGSMNDASTQGPVSVQQPIAEQSSASTPTSAPVPQAEGESTSSTLEYLDLQPQPGQMRLPNNAYDALRTHTQKLLDDGVEPAQIYQTQMNLINNIPIFKDEVVRLRADGAKKELSEYARSRLLRLPAVGLKIPKEGTQSSAGPSVSSTPSSTTTTNAPSNTAGQRVYPPQPRPRTTPSTPQPSAPEPSPQQSEASEKQKSQRAEYIRMQRDREQKARDERERIKAQIKADREERRRLDDLRRQNASAPSNPSADPEDVPSSSSAYARSGSTRSGMPVGGDVRVQVRTFDGTTLRQSFPSSSTITANLRPWIDSTTTTSTTPYNLKLILTPLPNRTIEAGEEDTSLSDLGIVGSCTLIMVPVKGYVESYGNAGGSGVLGGIRAAAPTAYNLVAGTAGWALGGVRSILGYNALSSEGQGQGVTEQTPATAGDGSEGQGGKVRVRTLADQRAEQERKNQQFYNGNSTNFQPRGDDDSKRD
jgi:hypothetical protein